MLAAVTDRKIAENDLTAVHNKISNIKHTKDKT